MISDMRHILKKMYPKSRGWSLKVDRMSDAQVFAIYIRLKNEGKVP